METRKDALNNERKDGSTEPPLANTVMKWVELEDWCPEKF